MSERVQASGDLDGPDYDRLVRSAGAGRQEIVVRLAGEAGLRPAEIARLALGDVESRDRGDRTYYFVRVGEGDSGRLAHLPADLESALATHAAEAGCADDDPIFAVSPRRIQMIVSDAADRAATELDEPALRSVSTRELRRFHARSLLDRGVDLRVVGEITAWNRIEALAESLDDPDVGEIVASLARADHGDGEGIAGDLSGDPTHEPAAADGTDRLATLMDRVVGLGRSLSNVSTREAIEREACEALATFYEYAWIASEVGNDTLEFRERSLDGAIGDGALDRLEGPPGTVSQEVYRTGKSAVTTGAALPLGDPAGPVVRAVVPIAHADATYGVLEVGVRVDPDAVADAERRVLEDLGRRLGQAIAAVERRRLLLADTVVRLSFACTDDRAVFVGLSSALDCSFALTGLVPGENGSLLAFVWLEGASPDDVFGRAREADAIDSARLIRSGEDGALLEFVLTGGSPALTLVECGGSLTELTATAGRGSLTAEFVPDVDVREVVESVEAAFPDSEMVTKREVERSVKTDTEFRQTLSDTLTDKQRSALRAAYHSGYFDWPRGSTAEELAESLGVSSPTFHSHLRRAQRKLLATFLEDGEP